MFVGAATVPAGVQPLPGVPINTVDPLVPLPVFPFGLANVSVTEHVTTEFAGCDENPPTVNGLAGPFADLVSPKDEVHVAVNDAMFVPCPVKATVTACVPEGVTVTPVGAGGGKNADADPIALWTP